MSCVNFLQMSVEQLTLSNISLMLIFNFMRDFIFFVFNVLIFCEIKSLKICNYYEQIVINK